MVFYIEWVAVSKAFDESSNLLSDCSAIAL